MGMKEQLSEVDLCVEQNVNSEKPIDFSVKDSAGETCCDVWGNTPDDVEFECSHPIVEFDDGEPVGECLLCGAKCDCHYEADDGNVEGYYWSGRRQVPTSWAMPDKPGGIIGDYLKDLQKRW